MSRQTGPYDSDFWGEPAPAPARGQKRRPRRRFPWLAFLLALGFLSLAYAGFRLAGAWLGEGLTLEGNDEDPQVAAAAKEGRLAVLLLGVDQRANEPSRADTIILALVDSNGPTLNLLSLPRDTYVRIPGRGQQKLAHAHAYGGPELAAETVSDFLGVPVTKYVEVNFKGFEQVIDTLGGVDYTVEKRMYYPPENIDLQPGPQHLNGAQALAYVRFRSDAAGDLGRIERQQKFLLAAADQALRLGNVLKLPDLVGEVRAAVRTNLSPREMLSLARVLRGVDPRSIRAAMLPGEGKYISGVSYYLADETEKNKIVADLFARKPDGGE